ncbi:MAG: urea transporter [Bacteroidota bacterium]
MSNKKNHILSTINSAIKSVLLSYSQIFFSNNLWFAGILLCVSFFDFWGGIAGLIAVVSTNIIALIIGFNHSNIKQGKFGFNALLVGLGIGVYFVPSFEFYFVLLIAVLLTLFLTVLFDGLIGKYDLPYLSLPFLVGLWMIILATRQFNHLEISQRGLFLYNEMYALGGQRLIDSYQWLNNFPIPESLGVYFRSLAAILFQSSLLAGILIAIGLLIYSRIAFSLSLISFFTAYYFYTFIGADISQLSYSFVGFNFIITAIAIGGFFIVASRHSYLWVMILVPIISVMIASFTTIFNVYQLAIYSLPFNIIVLLFLYVLKFRVHNYKRLQLVTEQNYSPELNLYNQQNYSARFSKSLYFPLELPIMDEWKITQAYDGEITHRGEWRHAFDFEIANDQNKFYSGNVFNVNHYFAYNKPVYAPGDGVVENIIDNIEDNQIGKVDLEHNWGNTIIIKHADGLYSNISHLKKDSFKVAIGDLVKRGEMIGNCGSSGRSPQPHVHFQLQHLPFIGSPTIEYPIVHYIERDKSDYRIHFFDFPKKDQQVSNINPTQTLSSALKFIPGQKLSFEVEELNSGTKKTVQWDVLVDYYNHSYLYCPDTKSSAYYYTDRKIFMFTKFYGSKKSELFYFYLSLYRISLGYYPQLIIEDSLPLTLLNYKPILWIQDFVAPMFIFLKSKYEARYIKKTEDFSKSLVRIESKATFGVHRLDFRTISFEIEFTNYGIEKIEFSVKQKRYRFKQEITHRTIN